MRREGKTRRDFSENPNPKAKSSFRNRQNEKKTVDDGKMRLNKFIANAGICSSTHTHTHQGHQRWQR